VASNLYALGFGNSVPARVSNGLEARLDTQDGARNCSRSAGFRQGVDDYAVFRDNSDTSLVVTEDILARRPPEPQGTLAPSGVGIAREQTGLRSNEPDSIQRPSRPGPGARRGGPGFKYGFNASNRYSISVMSSTVSFNSEAMGDDGTVLPGP